MNTKVGFTVLVLMLLVELQLGNSEPEMRMRSRKCGDAACKVHETSSRPVYFKLCDSRIITYYNTICAKSIVAKRRRRRGISADLLIQSKNEAHDFLSFRRRKRASRSTDIMEECCTEMCRTEEIREYC